MVIYGGVSPEHDVAIITALQVMNALKEAGHNVMPTYISKAGKWYLGNDFFLKPDSYAQINTLLRTAKKVVLPADGEIPLLTAGWLGFRATTEQPDVIFPVIHGKNGEDGTLQGLLEMTKIPYVGCGVTASGVKIDKYLAKKIAEGAGIKTLPGKLLIKGEKANKEALKKMKFPVMIKPVGLGSSIGLSRVNSIKELEDALEVAFCYDTRVMVEEALSNFDEVNISILGNGPYEVSMTEQPSASSEVLSFKDKYEGKENKKGMAGSKRFIPAKKSKETIQKIEGWAKDFFREIGGKGIARVDFLISKKGEVYFNEINTLPGSLAFYLWEASGVKFPKLVNKLVRLAIKEAEEKKRLVSTFESNILSGFANRGLKGGKA